MKKNKTGKKLKRGKMIIPGDSNSAMVKVMPAKSGAVTIAYNENVSSIMHINIPIVRGKITGRWVNASDNAKAVAVSGSIAEVSESLTMKYIKERMHGSFVAVATATDDKV